MDRVRVATGFPFCEFRVRVTVRVLAALRNPGLSCPKSGTSPFFQGKFPPSPVLRTSPRQGGLGATRTAEA